MRNLWDLKDPIWYTVRLLIENSYNYLKINLGSSKPYGKPKVNIKLQAYHKRKF